MTLNDAQSFAYFTAKIQPSGKKLCISVLNYAQKVAGSRQPVMGLVGFKKESGERKVSCKNLEVWILADQLVMEIHSMTLTELRRFEMFETGSQIRQSGKSVKATIVEGYGRKRYKADFMKSLVYGLASNDETTNDLETLFKTGSLRNEVLYNRLHDTLELLGKKIHLFIKGVDNSNWNK